MYSDEQIKGNLNSIDRQLMYDIRELIRENNRLLSNLISEPEAKKVSCRFCNGTHENRYQVAACAKKMKRGVNNGNA
jgi:hypothetical protein